MTYNRLYLYINKYFFYIFYHLNKKAYHKDINKKIMLKIKKNKKEK